MRHQTIAICALGLWHTISFAGEPMTMEGDNDKVNYSLGYDLGTDLKRQGLELTPDVLLQGIKDAMEGNEALVKPAERRKALHQIKVQRAQRNLEQSRAYLAEIAKQEGVVTLESGLQYKVIQAGEGKQPKATDTVVVNYRGRLIDGSEFDSSYKRGKPASFPVNKVIKGWQEALQLMQEGAKWELYIPSELAYGRIGRPKAIPPNSALVFEVELISVE